MRPHGVCTQAQCRLMSEKIITPDVITFHGGGGWWDVLGANLDTERRAERGEEAAQMRSHLFQSHSLVSSTTDEECFTNSEPGLRKHLCQLRSTALR